MTGAETLRRMAAFFVLVTVALPALAESLGPVSEEDPPAVCNPGWFLRSITCTGSYCDNKQISCYRPFADAALGRAEWTPLFSEEQGTRTCPSGFAVAGLACRGKYCDSVSLYCVEITNHSFANCTDTRFVSEEQPNQVAVFDNPNYDAASQRFVATGLSCKGSYCDNISLRVCEP